MFQTITLNKSIPNSINQFLHFITRQNVIRLKREPIRDERNRTTQRSKKIYAFFRFHQTQIQNFSLFSHNFSLTL